MGAEVGWGTLGGWNLRTAGANAELWARCRWRPDPMSTVEPSDRVELVRIFKVHAVVLGDFIDVLVIGVRDEIEAGLAGMSSL